MIKSMSDAEYFADPAVDQSGLKIFMKSPAKYAASLKADEEPTPAMRFGSLCHSYVLGSGGKFAAKPNLRTKAGKELAAKMTAKGYTFVDQSDIDTALAMSEVTAPYFEAIDGRPEMADFETLDGVECKGKYDWLPSNADDDGVLRIRDYKTTQDATDFAYDAWKYGYHIQAAFYMMLYRASGYDGFLGFEFVVQEKSAPYDYMVYRLGEDDREEQVARDRINQALESYKYIPKAEMCNRGYDHTPCDLCFTDWQVAREEALADVGW